MTTQPAVLTQFGLNVNEVESACEATLPVETTVNVLATATQCLFDVTVEVNPEVSFEVIVTRVNETSPVTPRNRKVMLRETSESNELVPTIFEPIIAKIEGVIQPGDLHF